MARKGLRNLYAKEAVKFLNHVMEDKPLLPFLIPLLLFAWAIERWIVPFSNWVPLAVAVWATIQYGKFERQLLVEDLNRKWKQFMLNTSPITPVEPCEWLNKLLLEVWPNYIEPKISRRFSTIVEKRLKHRKPKVVERIELLEFSLGSCPPNLGSQGTHWYTSGDQRVLRMGFDWVTNDMSILLSAKLARPLRGTARIIVNNMHVKGNLLLMPILDGQAVLFSFESTPEVRMGIAFGSGGSQTMPATELPGVSTWLVKLFSETLAKTIVEPRRGCYSLPSVDLRKRAVGGVLSVTIVSARELVGSSTSNIYGSRRFSGGNDQIAGSLGNANLQTFVEVEIGELTRRTSIRHGSDPRWGDTFNMILHGDNGIIKFNLYEWGLSTVKFDYLTTCEIKVKYVPDDSTTFWAIGPGSGIVAKHAEYCGKEVQMVVPFEGENLGELTVRLVLKEWQFTDESSSLRSSTNVRSQYSTNGSANFQLRTGRKIKVTILEGRNLTTKSGKCDPYVKLQYGKALRRTKSVSHDLNPEWNQTFEFDEIGDGEYLKLKCYSADVFGDDIIGSARVHMDGIPEGSRRDVWIPLEKVNTGELRIQMEALKGDNSKHSLQKNGGGWIELVLIEAKDLIAADLRGTSDPYVRVQYGSMKKRTKVVYKTLNPQWNQTLEFPDTGNPLVFHVKDHNAVLPTSSIGDCVVEYERLPPNQMVDKWIPLQGVKSGEIHIQITRKFPELEKKSSLDTDISGLSKASQISGKIRDQFKKLQLLVEDGDLDSLSLFLSEVESAADLQEEYMMQLENEKTLLLNKINELGREINRTSNSTITLSGKRSAIDHFGLGI